MMIGKVETVCDGIPVPFSYRDNSDGGTYTRNFTILFKCADYRIYNMSEDWIIEIVECLNDAYKLGSCSCHIPT